MKGFKIFIAHGTVTLAKPGKVRTDKICSTHEVGQVDRFLVRKRLKRREAIGDLCLSGWT